MLGTVTMKYKTASGEIEEKVNPKFWNFTDDWYKQAKQAYKNKGMELLKVTLVFPVFKINPEWKNYNNIFNEGEEGYNPHNQFLPTEHKTTIWEN